MPARDCSRQICGFAFKTNDNECTTVGSQRSREISYRRTLSRARGRYCDRCSFPTLCRNIFRDRQQRLQFWNFAPASLSRSLVLPLVSITIPLQLDSATSKLLTPKTQWSSDACVCSHRLKCRLQNGRCVTNASCFWSCWVNASVQQINSRGKSSFTSRAINYIV